MVGPAAPPQRAGYVDWVFRHWIQLGAMFVAISVALLVVMFLARLVGDWWWIPGAGAFVVIAAVFVFAQPYLVTGTTPLRDPALRRAVETFERKQGISGVPVSIEDVSGTTSQANAYAIGFGPSRKVVLWNTLLDGSFPDGAVRVVIAHELGHHSSNHIPKAIGWFGPLRAALRVGADARHPPPRRHGRGGVGAPGPARGRRPPACARSGSELDQQAHGGRGRLEGAADDTRPRSCA